MTRVIKAPPPPQADWAYFLDVDGTLIDLARTPAEIWVDQALLDLVTHVHRETGGALALVSGRAIADLDAHLKLAHLPAAEQHGLERRDGQGNLHRHMVSPVCCEAITQILGSLKQRHPGLRLERKGASFAVHYRQAPRLGGYLKRILSRFAEQSGGLQLQPGKKVFEIKPRGFDKGSAILEFMGSKPFCGRRPVFIGDDLTDEHGFAAINELGGVSIKVGPGKSRAKHRLVDVRSVRDWLGKIETETTSAKERHDEKY